LDAVSVDLVVVLLYEVVTVAEDVEMLVPVVKVDVAEVVEVVEFVWIDEEDVVVDIVVLVDPEEVELEELLALVVVVVVPDPPPSWGVIAGTDWRLYMPEAAMALTFAITPGENARRAALVVSSSDPRFVEEDELQAEYDLEIPPSEFWRHHIVFWTDASVIPEGMTGVPITSAASRKVPRYIPLAGDGPISTEPSEFNAR